MRKIVILAMVVFLVLGLAGLGLAATKKVAAKPFIFDPEDSGLAAAAWVTHQGLPDAGKSAHALMLQISPAEPPVVGVTPYQAGAAIKGAKGLELTELGFDIKNDWVFTTGPRFEVVTDGGTFLFPFAAALLTPVESAPADWTRARFDLTTLTGVVQTVRIIFEEEGSVLLDNIDINGALMGKPGNAKFKFTKPKKEKNVT
jgi:hypothetical protein